MGMINRVLLLRESITKFVKWYVEDGGGKGRDEDEEDDFNNWEFSETDWIDLKYLSNILTPYKKAT